MSSQYYRTPLKQIQGSGHDFSGKSIIKFSPTTGVRTYYNADREVHRDPAIGPAIEYPDGTGPCYCNGIPQEDSYEKTGEVESKKVRDELFRDSKHIKMGLGEDEFNMFLENPSKARYYVKPEKKDISLLFTNVNPDVIQADATPTNTLNAQVHRKANIAIPTRLKPRFVKPTSDRTNEEPSKIPVLNANKNYHSGTGRTLESVAALLRDKFKRVAGEVL